MDEEESSSNSGEDDPIVREIPIFLSKRLENQLYVFQYPMRPKLSKTELNIKNSSFKPINKEVKLEMGLNVESSNFDPLKAEEIALDIDKDLRKKDVAIFDNDMHDKITFASNKVMQETSKYAIGVYNGKEYHLTPLSGFLQLRPSLEYLDKTLKRKKDHDDIPDDEAEAGPSTSSAHAVTVKFARTETEKSVKARETSYRSLKEKSDSEKWVECQWHKCASTFSEVQKQRLFCETTGDTGQCANVTSLEYLRLLVPEDQEQAIVKPSLPSNIVSLHALRALPLHEQCRLLLKDAKIIQFQQLMMLLAGGQGITADTLLKSLPYVATLVQGNWVVKSEVLYPQNTLSSISGVPADVMCRARDYVLYLFTQNQYVDRRKVCSVIRLPNEEVKEIFTGVAKLKHNRGWELMVPSDLDFVSRHSDTAQRQKLLWEQRAKQLEDLVTRGAGGSGIGGTTLKEKRARRKSKSTSDKEEMPRTKKDSMSSDTDSDRQKSPVAARRLSKTKHLQVLDNT